MEYKGGTTYEIEWDDTQPKSDTWFYEELVAPHKRHVASVGFPARRDDVVADHLRRDASRVLRPEGAPRRHGRRPRRGVAVLPDVPALLRPDVLGGTGQGSRVRLCPCLQRLDGRGVVRRFRRTAHPAVHRAAVGRRARGGRGAPQRGAGRHRGRVLGDPRQARAAHPALRLLGAVLRGVRRDRDAGVHAHRVVVADAGHVGRRAARRCRRRSASATRCRR